MKTQRLEFSTGHEKTIVDLTAAVQRFVADEQDGLLNISLLHATAGLALIEMHSGTEDDLMDAIERLLPSDTGYAHSHGSPGHGASHVLPAFLSPTVTLPVVSGKVALGTWQHIAMVDTNVDNPKREVLLSFLPG